eukprot:5056326-Prymnesium_polylepis.1
MALCSEALCALCSVALAVVNAARDAAASLRAEIRLETAHLHAYQWPRLAWAARPLRLLPAALQSRWASCRTSSYDLLPPRRRSGAALPHS